MARHLVFVGGGHAHLSALLHLREYTQRGYRVTLVSPSPYHYYSGMGPGLLAGIYKPREVRFNIRKMGEDRGARFVRDEVVKIDAERRVLHLLAGETLHYDVASFNVGSNIAMQGLAPGSQNLIPVKPIANLHRARLTISRMPRDMPVDIVVVGGGPAGIEVAANAWRLLQNNRLRGTITVVGGSSILDSFPEKARNLVRKSFAARRIDLLEGSRVRALRHGQAVLADGRSIRFDFAFLAVGVQPPELFRLSALPTGADGGLLVNEQLQCVSHPEIFGGGDCIQLQGHPLARVGVHAVRQNPILRRNLMAALEGGKLQRFKPQDNFMLILNMGDNTGVLRKNHWVLNGRMAFRLKDYIDRRFMKKYQVSGEMIEIERGEL
jgi:NADH dehydrogenase FAD-containing subunit